MSGPSFAAEVAKEHPTAVTIASESEDVAVRAQELLSTSRFRCYTTNDVVGVELGGALKNVLAIACGISDGMGFGANARAALITRGEVQAQPGIGSMQKLDGMRKNLCSLFIYFSVYSRFGRTLLSRG